MISDSNCGNFLFLTTITMGPKKRGCGVKRSSNGTVKFATSSKDPDERVTLESVQALTENDQEMTVKEQCKKERQQPLHLNNDQQDSVIQWFQDNELLYGKGLCVKLTEKKTTLLKEGIVCLRRLVNK